MEGTSRITNRASVDAALSHPCLVPPPATDAIGSGATAELRDAMARFRSGDAHDRARADVDAAISSVDVGALRSHVDAVTREHLAMREDCDIVADIGFVVPTEALAIAIGVPSAELAEVRRDVRSIVMSIGRGEAATAVADNASRRLVERFDGHPGGAVATVSMLYQNHDATAALLASRLVANAHGTDRQTALARTVRIATDHMEIGDTVIPRDTIIEVGLDDPTHEFGAGPHRCPGVELAEAIVDVMCAVLDELGWVVDLGRAVFAADGRATSLPRLYEQTRQP